MPRRDDIRTVLVIGSGPIVIGQACEFDYSGAQACKVLREDGYRVVLVNSNPATIMTDPEFADRTYVEPVTPEFVAKVIEIERPDALLPTLGGQTGLNCAVALAESGVLERFGVELIGAKLDVIKKGEDRRLFAAAMGAIGLEVPVGDYAYAVADAERFAGGSGYPVVVRPSFTMGGAGGGIAYNIDELREIVSHGIALSPIGEVLVEESVIGWKEYEMEVMRDRNDNAVIVCSIENIDAMGVHTGDSITVAPAQTLTDREYQAMRDASLAILREIGVETGGSNVQFAVNPADGRMVVIEMNPRVSRSSALASKATGFPIAKIAAKLAVGYTLDEISNDITKVTPACFEPSIDYTVVKVPRWAFEKFKGTDTTLTTRMKSVGEAMAIGRTFAEALGKAFRSLENGRYGLGADGKDVFDELKFDRGLTVPNENRMYYVADALWRGRSVQEVSGLTHIDPWFLDRVKAIVEVEGLVRQVTVDTIDATLMRKAKQHGLSDPQIAYLLASDEAAVRARRLQVGVKATFKAVDTCAGEFLATTPYYYKTYEQEDEVTPATRPRIMILGAGPNRIGQGIEFDYCCVHASYALHDAGFETVMVNCNPETVSTDYDTSDRLYFEPLTFEDVMDVVEAEKPVGVLVTFGGQTPLKLARRLEEAGVPILGTKPESIDLAEDRERFAEVLDRLKIAYPAAGTARSQQEAIEVAARIGYPLLVRPSYVLGGRGMVIAYNEEYLLKQFAEAVIVSPDHPVLLDRFLEGAIEVDVDAVCDGAEVYVGGVMEHIEEAGIHSGDSACCIPPYTLSRGIVDEVCGYTRRIALEIGTHGLINIQFAVKDETVYVLEVNPRASRTVPFVSKATGVPLAKVAARVMAGEMLSDLALPGELRETGRFCVKEAVMPFGRFPGADSVLGPEMKSTGEVMGSAADFPAAYAKSQLAIDYSLPTAGAAFISVCDRDKRAIVGVARHLHTLGFEVLSTQGTARALRAAGLPVTEVLKVHEGRPNIVDRLTNNEVHLVINTPFGRETRSDGYHIRAAAIRHGVTNITTVAAAQAVVQAIQAAQDGRLGVSALQDTAQWSPPPARGRAGRRRTGYGQVSCSEFDSGPHPMLEAVEVLSNDRVAEGVGLMALHSPRIAGAVRPGQFVHLRITDGADLLLRRPFSVHRAEGDRIELLYQVLGRGTRAMADKSRGELMDAIGPLGTGWEVGDGVGHALLVAGGLGAAPLGMLAERLAARGVAVSVALGAPTAERLVARGLFESVARRVEVATDDGSAGERGFVTVSSGRMMIEARPDVVCVCGPEAMSRTVAAQAADAGVPCRVSLERLMACGIGACLSCVVTTAGGRKRACVDGPVFDAKEVCWDGSEVPPRH